MMQTMSIGSRKEGFPENFMNSMPIETENIYFKSAEHSQEYDGIYNQNHHQQRQQQTTSDDTLSLDGGSLLFKTEIHGITPENRRPDSQSSESISNRHGTSSHIDQEKLPISVPESVHPIPADKTHLHYSSDHPKVQNAKEAAIEETQSRFSSLHHHLASDHGELEDKPMTAKGYIWVAFCFTSSFSFCIMGLTWLASCAAWSGLKKKYKHKKETKKERRNEIKKEGHVAKNDPPSLDKANKKLTRSLGYYVEVSKYKMETHSVTTSDGFVLELQHIVNPNDTPEERASKYPVLLLHGLLQSAAAYATSGENSLAFFLLEAGYDVWLGNNRNGSRPRHTHYSYYNLRFWSWRIREMGTRDVPALLDYILKQCSTAGGGGAQKVALVAHSQGTAETFLALSKDWIPELGDKISCFAALSPAVYGGKLLDRYFLKWVRKFDLSGFRFFFGHHAFFPIMMQVRPLMLLKAFTKCGYIMFSYLFEWNDHLWDKRFRDRQFIFSPVYVSAELMHWWLGKGGFADRGCIFEHDDPNTPWFNSKLPPVCLFCPGTDELVDPYKLVDRFRNVEAKFEDHDVTVVDIPEYSHLDVLWAADAVEKVGKPLSNFIWRTRHEVPGHEWRELKY